MQPESETIQRLFRLTLAAALLVVGGLVSSASADVYYYKDADGVFHFTNTRRPDAAPFIIERPLANLRTSEEVDLGVPESGDYDRLIAKYSKRFRVERALIKAVIRAESGFNRMARSSCGARGLMQLMPGTAKHYEVRNVWDPEQNIEGGVHVLSHLIERHRNSLPRALAAYNAGSDAVERYRGIPPIAQTQVYVARVLRYRQLYLKEERMAALARSS